MNTRATRALLASAAVIFLLSSSAAVFADSPQILSLAMPAGGVTDLGVQTYNVAGGQVVYAAVDGRALDPGATIQYSFVASQAGSSTSGIGQLSLTGTIPGEGQVTVTGNFGIDSIQAIAQIGTSFLPGFFQSTTPDIQTTIGGTTVALSQPLVVESPYLDPFGGPIVMASADGYTLTVVATYSTGTIQWKGTQLQGPLSGTLGATPVSGFFTLADNEFEDLVAGTATDAGKISFNGMKPASLNVDGKYQGTDSIPSTGAIDCSAYTGVPGTCIETGFLSSGTFSAQGVRGSYSTTWSTPALGFSGGIQATTSRNGGQNGHSSGSNPSVSGVFGLPGA